MSLHCYPIALQWYDVRLCLKDLVPISKLYMKTIDQKINIYNDMYKSCCCLPKCNCLI